MYLVTSVVLLLIIIGLMLLSHKLKLAYEHRILHIRSVLISIVFGVLAVSLFVGVLNLIDAFLSFPAVRAGLFRIMPSVNIASSFFWIIALLSCIVICAAYCIVQLLVVNVWLKTLSKKAYLRKKNPITKLFNWIGSLSYEIVDGTTIKPVWANVGHWIRVMRNLFSGVLILEAVALPVYLQLKFQLVDDLLLTRIVKSVYMIPVITWFVLDQVSIYLQASAKPEGPKLMTEDTGLTHIGDYKKLIDLYKKIFGDGALISCYVNKNAPEKSLFSGPDEDQLKRAENPELLSAVCRSVNNLIQPLSPHFIDALVDLINGKSVAVFDSYSGEFLLFYFAYLQKDLYLRRTALIICDDEAQVDEMIAQVKEIFSRLNKIHPVWKIQNIDSMQYDEEPADILICTEEQLLHSPLDNQYPDFSGRLHNVLVLHAYDIMCRANSFAFRFFNSLKSKHVQFAFLVPENNRDMDSGLEARLGNETISLYDSFREEAGASILCWRGESFFKTQQAISMDLFHDFGMAYTIALIAVKHGVSTISIHAPMSIPLNSYRETVNSYLSRLSNQYFQSENVSLDSVVRHNPVVLFQIRDISFDIFYDEYNNLLNVAKQALSSCAEQTSVVHIISRPYMLRDYFAAHLQSFVRNDWGMQMIVPAYHYDLRALSVSLLLILRERGMTIEEILSYMHSFGVEEDNIERILAMALQSVYGDQFCPQIYTCFSFGEQETVQFTDNRYVRTRVVRLSNESVYRKVCAMTENNVTVTGALSMTLPIPRSSVYNRFLCDQRFSFKGARYEIVSINNGCLTVREEESVERETEYTTIYDLPEFILEDEPKRVWKDNSHYSRALFRAKVTRSINGYFSHIKGMDFAGDNTRRYSLNPIVEMRDAECLRLQFRLPSQEKLTSSIAAMFVILFRGILVSALPNNYKDILVVSQIDRDKFDDELFDQKPENALRRDPLPSDWIETGFYDLPLSRWLKLLFPKIEKTNMQANDTNCINLYLIDFSDTGSHILPAVAEETTRILNTLYGYVHWVTKNPDLKHNYLKFGYNQIPEIFRLAEVASFLERVADYSPVVSGELHDELVQSDLSGQQCCSFCGRPLTVSNWKFEDGRNMCEECHKHRTEQRKEIEDLLHRAYETIENKYQIKLPTGIKIRFKSASSIAAAGGTVSGGRILGFYNANKREIWIERGGPEACVMSTLMHELTHAWQFDNLPDIDKMQLYIIEGHAVYVEIECSRLLGQTVYADFWEKCVLLETNEYSKGLRYWTERLMTESDKNIFHHIQNI
ncbi:MAG: hypothetical protein IJT41_02620 [Clostridia bacterium]|nr:hypothetical protein [Clostridia bacterium]